MLRTWRGAVYISRATGRGEQMQREVLSGCQNMRYDLVQLRKKLLEYYLKRPRAEELMLEPVGGGFGSKRYSYEYFLHSSSFVPHSLGFHRSQQGLSDIYTLLFFLYAVNQFASV